jgi:hypothetical protein
MGGQTIMIYRGYQSAFAAAPSSFLPHYRHKRFSNFVAFP